MPWLIFGNVVWGLMGICSDTGFLENGKTFLLTFLMPCISQLQGSHLFD